MCIYICTYKCKELYIRMFTDIYRYISPEKQKNTYCPGPVTRPLQKLWF